MSKVGGGRQGSGVHPVPLHKQAGDTWTGTARLYTELTPELLKCFLDHLKLNKEKLCFSDTTTDLILMLRLFF